MKKLLQTVLAAIPAFGGTACVAPKLIEPRKSVGEAEISTTQEAPTEPEYINFGGYVVVSPVDARKDDLVLAVGQIFSTEEGKEILKQANELHKKPIKVLSWGGGRSRFTSETKDKNIGGIVWVDFDNLANSLYLDGSGKLHDNSLQRVIFHELLHAADPELVKTPLENMPGYEGELFLFRRHKAMLPVENAFMAAHFLEKPFDQRGRLIDPKEVGMESFLQIHKIMLPCNEIVHAEATAIYAEHGKQFGLQ